MYNKKLVTGIILILGIITLAGVGFSYSSKQDSNITSNDNTDTSNLPIYTIKGDFIYDTNNVNESVGIVDYVFLGEVISHNGTTYEDIITTENEDGKTLEAGTPYTNYSIQIKENIKGKLQTDAPIKIKKHGGVTQDNKSVFLFRDDCLPEVGKHYVFLAYAQPDGSLLVSGPNSNVLDMNSTSKKDVIVEKYKDATKNEVVNAERERYSSAYEE